MGESQTELGQVFLDSMAKLRQRKGDLSLEDIGGLLLNMSSHLQGAASDVDMVIHNEISQLVKYIDNAKSEIFSISYNENQEQAIVDASQHLDEVIKDTEKATTTIMDSADAIQGAVSGVGGDKEEQIMDATHKIYEACNFQDITGQRINKVIKLLTHIEERVNKLNTLFGNTPPEPLAEDASRPKSDAELLNGPQLSSEAKTQEEIDALFNSVEGNPH